MWPISAPAAARGDRASLKEKYRCPVRSDAGRAGDRGCASTAGTRARTSHVPGQPIAAWHWSLLNSGSPPTHIPLGCSLCQQTPPHWPNQRLSFSDQAKSLASACQTHSHFIPHVLGMMNPLKHSLAKLKKLLRMAKWLSVKQLCSLMVLYARGSATKKQHSTGS